MDYQKNPKAIGKFKLVWLFIIYLIYRIVVTGTLNYDGYISKFMPESITNHPDFTTSTEVMNIIPFGSENISTNVNAYIGALQNYSVSTVSYFNQSLTYNVVSNKSYDIQYLTYWQSYSVNKSSFTLLIPDMPWSSSGSISISFSLSMFNSIPLESWITIDSSTGILTVVSPDVSQNTTYSFYILSAVSGFSNPVQKLIKITVVAWSVTNWLQCSSQSATIWTSWSNGYKLNSGLWVINSAGDQVSATAEALKISNISILGASSCIIAIFSSLNASSLSSIWSIVNQIQLLFLLLLTLAYTPVDVEYIIIGQNFALNPFGALFSINFVESLTDLFKINLSNSRLELLNISSDSTAYNTAPFAWFLLLIVIIHTLTYLFWKIIFRLRGDKWSWFVKSLKCISNKVLNYLTFGFYIRSILEYTQYLAICIINEFYYWNTSQPIWIISLFIAFILLWVYLLIFGIILFLAVSSYRLAENSHNKLAEFFEGIKFNKRHKLYIAIQFVRKTVFIIVLLTLAPKSSVVVIIWLSVIQLSYVIYLAILRPFEEPK